MTEQAERTYRDEQGNLNHEFSIGRWRLAIRVFQEDQKWYAMQGSLVTESSGIGWEPGDMIGTQAEGSYETEEECLFEVKKRMIAEYKTPEYWDKRIARLRARRAPHIVPERKKTVTDDTPQSQWYGKSFEIVIDCTRPEEWSVRSMSSPAEFDDLDPYPEPILYAMGQAMAELLNQLTGFTPRTVEEQTGHTREELDSLDEAEE